MTTFGIADGDHTGRQRISDALATAGVGVNPPLAHLGPDQQVRLAIGRSPAVVAQQAMPPSQPNVAGARQRGLRRPVTLAALLLALLVSAVLFASLATIAVLAIDDPGPQGQQGVAGVQGAQGVQGKRGKKGRTGRTGKSGLNGANGANGAPGATRACSNDIEVPLPYC